MWDLATFILQALIYASVLSAAGGALFLALFPTVTGHERRRIGSVTLLAAGLGALLTAAALALRAGFLSGTGLGGMFDPFFLGMLLDSAVGASAKLRWLGLALIGCLWLRRPFGDRIGALGALLVVVSFSLAGHSASLEQRLSAGSLVALHLVAVSYWIGALWPLLRLSQAPDTDRVAQVLERFGTLAMVLVGTLVVAGATLAWLLLGGFSPLWETRYGNIFAFKLGVFAWLLALAALNRFRLVPRFAKGEPGAGTALRRSITAELIAVAAILAATAALTTFSSPFEA